MTEPPLVSVVVPAFNAQAYVGEAIESVLTQTYQHLECIVVNDGSTDCTGDIIRSFGDRVVAFDQRSAGVSQARNLAIEASRGTWLAFLDADDLWASNKLERQICHAEALGKVDVHTTNAAVERDHLRCQDFFEHIKLPPKYFDGVLEPPSECLLSYSFAWLQTTIIRKSLVERKVGPFDTGLKIYEDLDLFLYLSLFGRWAICPEVLVDIKRRESSNVSLSGLRYRNELEALQTMLRVLLNYKENSGGLPVDHKKINKRISNQYIQLGNYYKKNGSRTNSISMYKQALIFWPSAKSFGKILLS